MDILGIGFPELLFIFVIALMVFGPRRLPEIAGKVGRVVRDLRNMSQGFLAEWQREITVAARLEELEEVRKELAETKQVLQQSHTEISDGAAQIGQSVKSVARAPSLPAPSPAETKSSEAASPSTETPPPPETAPAPESIEPSQNPGPPEKNSSSQSPIPTDTSEVEASKPDKVEAEKNGVGTKTQTPVTPPEMAE